MTRKKITDDIAGYVMHKSDFKCCKCQSEGIQIHHLDEDSSNGEPDNLACLCLVCHNQATTTGGLTRKLSEATIRRYRDDWYEVVEIKRQAARNILSNPTQTITADNLLVVPKNELSTPIQTITAEDMLVASKNALIIIELVKIRQDFYATKWEDRGSVLDSLDKYYPHTNFRLAYDIFSFFTEITEYNRGAMTKDVALSIYSLVLNFFPYSEDEADKEKTIELSNECCRVGYNIAFDAAIYLKDYTVIMYGLTILKYVHKRARTQKIQIILDKVDSLYDELENQLSGSEYRNYLELIGIFRTDLATNSLAFPFLSENLMQVIYPDLY